MIKKLYSSKSKNKKEIEEDEASNRGTLLDFIEDDKDKNSFASHDSNSDPQKVKTETMIDEMSTREVFSYRFCEHYFATSCICKTCCCRKQKRNDRLYTDATKKLHKEIDILEITKNQRILRLLSEVYLNFR